LKYIKEFDALRAFAVLAVMFQHYLSQYKILSLFGSSGVTLFFVLSGYLITQILVTEKLTLNIDFSNNLTKLPGIIKTFFIRRCLRIFPIYYLTLCVLIILNIDSAKEWLPFHFFYLSNYLYSFYIGFDRLGHFWSLAVEEQFYLLWPFIILFIPLNISRVRFFCFLIFCSVLFKIWMVYLYGLNSDSTTLLMPACIEAFAIGAIAVELKDKNIKKGLLFTLQASTLLIFIGLYLLFFLYPSDISIFVFKVFGRTFFSSFSAILLLIIVKDYHSGFLKAILNFKPLLFLGKISYGVYIYHMFVPYLFKYLQNKFHFDLSGSGVNLLMHFIVSFIIAYISFRFIETPINNLKRKFAYK
jgi:peptidoglycan/LPS O-acetylase OafA/YrhL